MKRRLLSIFLVTLLLFTGMPHHAFAASVLRNGSRGSEVTGMQQRLIQLGYLGGKADGIFGSKTEGAVRNFQKVHNLTVDGIAGPKTLDVLYSSGAKPAGSGSSGGGSTAPSTGATPIQRLLRRGDRGSDVAALQTKLNELKYNAGTPDGIFGPATENAVRAFQRAKGLAADGIVGSLTTAALFSGASAGTPGNPPATGGGSANPITSVLKKGSRGSEVTALQNKLNALGYSCGAADGIFGQATWQAVVNFQRTNQLAADGIVGPATASRLFSTQSGSGSSPEPTPTPTPTPPPTDPVPEVPVSQDLKGKIVIIDPGHGGKDPGACHGGLQEKDLALDMGLRLRDKLERAGATVYMTRSDDRYVSLFYRSAFANKVVLEREINDVKAKKAAAEKNLLSVQAALPAGDEVKTQAVQPGDETETKDALPVNDETETKDALPVNDGAETKDALPVNDGTPTQEGTASMESPLIRAARQAAGDENSSSEQNNRTLSSEMAEYDNTLAELQRLLNGFQAYFNNPALESRTGIYAPKISGSLYYASDDLQKVMDLTREKYQDDIIYVSIHLNATTTSPQYSASGVYTFYGSNNPGGTTTSQYYKNYNEAARKRLATSLLLETNKVTNFSKQKTIPNIDNFSVLRESNVVSTLVEVGFMNNPNDLSLIGRPEFRENVTYGLYRGILEYFR